MSTAVPVGHSAEFDLLPVVTIVLRFRATVLRIVALFTLFGVAHSLLAGVRYTATTSFVVASSQGIGGFGGLAALADRLGTRIPGDVREESPYFYMAALKTYEVVDPTLTTPIPLPVASPEVGDPRKQDTIQLLDWYETDAREALARRLDVGRKILAKQVRVSLDERSGVITVEVSDRDPRIAAGVAATLVANLNDFNLRSQQTTSRATREFLEGRLAAVMAELTRAEEDARNFLRVNRRLQDSPTLQLEYSRLQRRVDILQQGYVELASQVEHARSAEVRDTPVITVLQRPTPPARRSSPRRKLIVVGWFLVGSVCAIAWVGARAWLLQYSSSGSTAWSDFVNELSAIRRRDKRSKHPPRG